MQVVLGVALPGHECIGVRLKKRSDNQHVLGEACGKAQGWGGGMASAMAPIRNDAPRASRNAAVAFIARMDIAVRQ